MGGRRSRRAGRGPRPELTEPPTCLPLSQMAMGTQGSKRLNEIRLRSDAGCMGGGESAARIGFTRGTDANQMLGILHRLLTPLLSMPVNFPVRV